MIARYLVISLLGFSCCGTAVAQESAKVQQVAGPTKLDWIYALANQSPAKPPTGWLEDDYDSTTQFYSLVLPKHYDRTKPSPVLLFISPGKDPAGIKQWAATCQELGVLLASPHNAGNKCPTRQRTRIIMDVLGDLRTKHNIDPDRCYLGGFSGGARMACSIAFALPEYFGGVLPVCAGGELRSETYLRHRVIDRLSVAQLTGDTDFNRGEVERLHQTELSNLGVRCKTWVATDCSHRIPNANVFTKAIEWLEEDVPRRQQLAKKWPTSRQPITLTRKQWSDRLLDEAKKRLDDPDTLYSGLMQLKGIHIRWIGSDASRQAKLLLTLHEQEDDLNWQAEDILQQLQGMTAKARALDAYGSGPLPKQYANQKNSILEAAVSHWQAILQATNDAELKTEAQERINALRQMVTN